MGTKLVFFGDDGIFDRNDLFMWVGLIGLIVFLGAEAYDKIVKSVAISDWAYITITSLILGKGALNALFSTRNGEAGKKEDIGVLKK